MDYIGTLTPHAPYNFPLLLDMLSRYVHPVIDRVHEGAYWRAVKIDDQLILVKVQNAGTLHAPALDVFASVHDCAAAELLDTVHHIFALAHNPTPFYAFAQSDETLWRIVEPLQGVMWPRAASAFEALMTTIIEQQISWVAAQKAQRWLVEWAGHCIVHDSQPFYAFPTPEQIAVGTEALFTPMKITFKRMRLMIEIAEQVDAGVLDLEGLRDVPLAEAYAALLRIKGVGHWTASWTLTRTIGAGHSYVGANDVALQAAVNRYFYGQEGKISADLVAETFARYGEFAGLAAHYTILRWVLEKY